MRRYPSTVCAIVLAFGLLLLAGCEKKIDASSKAAFDKSTEEITKDLDDAKKEQFTGAVGAMMMKHVLFASGPDVTDEAGMMKKVKETFHGKTAEEVIAEGEKIKKENNAEMQKLIQGS
jgi:hypothetical protein